MQLQRCGNCHWWTRVQQKVGNCFLNPPIVAFVPVIKEKNVGIVKEGPQKGMPMVEQSVSHEPHSARPITLEDHGCQHWKQRNSTIQV